ncbi:unnamed protein product [Bursaphelenchus xylophilus]|uniref:(pine wood nematode) hypothetical protein n=1 Tax=Bursaphelenchus xylophilus TaxID=6326 RepID=A0A1I7SD90_BURXY|nr:unnamed protein product [Bursaphelenchus xylophilus]CAG9130544.1 unnamed protein product [Bursaphelenchus xylophilus]
MSSNLEKVYQQIRCIKSRPREVLSFDEIQDLLEDAKKENYDDSIVHLLEAYNYIRIGCFEEALFSVVAFFDYYENSLPKKGDRKYERRYSTLKHGLVLVATLHRFFGSYLPGSALLTQATANAHDNHDVSEYRFCMLEERAYNLNAVQTSMNPALRRNIDDPYYMEDLNKRFLTRFHSDQVHLPSMGLEEAFRTFIAAGFAHKSPRFKAIAQHFRMGLVFINALHCARTCDNLENLSKYLNVCLENEIASQWRMYANDIEDGALAIHSTVVLANGCTALEEKHRFLRDDELPEKVTEGELIMGVNAAYAYACQGLFDNAKSVLSGLRKNFPSASNPMLSIHWQLAEQCILYDCEFFRGEFEKCEERLPYLNEYSQPESLFRKCMLDCAFGCYKEEELLEFLSSIRKSSDPHLKIRARIALGNLKVVNGDVENGISNLERASASAKRLKLSFLEASAKRRLAFAYICRQDFQKASSILLSLEMVFEDVDVVAVERFLYYSTWLELFNQKAVREPLNADEKMSSFRFIMKAANSIPHKGFPLLESELYLKACFFVHDHCSNLVLANVLAKLRESTGIELVTNSFNYFVL